MTTIDDVRIEHTDAGTPAGRYLRRFWHPVLLSRELGVGRAAPVRLLGEDFTLYRGDDGAVRLVEPRCPHRLVLLSIGSVEGNCLRCRYHGWKFDPTGQCLEQPGEPVSFAHKVRIRTWPVREYLGLVWAYIGEDPPPPPPRWPQVEGDYQRIVTSELRKTNFLPDLENVIDDVHLRFVHPSSVYHDPEQAGAIAQLSAEETDYGLVQRSVFPDGRTRELMCIMPNCVYFRSSSSKARGLDGMLWIVPCDDTSHKIYFTLTAVDGEMRAPDPADAAVRAAYQTLPSVESEVEGVLSGRKRFEDISPRPDRSLVEDHVILRAQGVFVDRSKQWLGKSDEAILLLRRLYAREITAYSAGRPVKEFHFPETLRPL